MQAARAGGAKIYVYVPTGYLTKNTANASLAAGRISSALADPDIDGVFLDEVRSGCSVKAQNDYTAMYNQAATAGKRLVYNPGQTAGSCFNTISNASVNFEGTASSYLTWPASEWGRALGSDKSWQIMHGATITDIPSMVALAKARNAGLIWVAQTDQWTQFPDATYFAALRNAIGSSVTPTVPTSPTSSTTTTTAAPTSTTIGTGATVGSTVLTLATGATTDDRGGCDNNDNRGGSVDHHVSHNDDDRERLGCCDSHVHDQSHGLGRSGARKQPRSMPPASRPRRPPRHRRSRRSPSRAERVLASVPTGDGSPTG